MHPNLDFPLSFFLLTSFICLNRKFFSLSSSAPFLQIAAFPSTASDAALLPHKHSFLSSRRLYLLLRCGKDSREEGKKEVSAAASPSPSPFHHEQKTP